MAKDRNGSLSEREDTGREEKKERDHGKKSKRKVRENSESEVEEERKHTKSDKTKRNSKRKSGRRHSYEDSFSSSSSDDDDSGSSYSDSEDSHLDSESEGSDAESESERRRRKRRERRKRRDKEEDRERRRRKKEKERKRRRKDRDEEKKKKKRKKKEKKEKKEKKMGKKGAVTNTWGKYGIIRETDMWNKRPEFTAWLAEVKQVNLESLPNWEEKQMFKQFMEDHNTATFPSKKYYGLDAYYKHKMEKEMERGFKKASETERTVFNDEEQRRQELLLEREKQKEEQVEALKLSMQSGMAQAMKEQAQLREEMAYQYKLGNFEAAAAIQRRLDPDVPM